jgi:hypothetical protein
MNLGQKEKSGQPVATALKKMCFWVKTGEKQTGGYSAGFVFGKPIGLRPSFQLPRACKSFTRSKRLSTLRFEPTDLDFFRLGCCDIKFQKI